MNKQTPPLNRKAPRIEDYKIEDEQKTIQFLQRNNPPTNGIIYKYRNWNDPFHRNILKGKLFFSSSSKFNDPFDCRVPINKSLFQNSNFESQINNLYEKLLKTHSDLVTANTANIIEKLDFVFQCAEIDLGICCFSCVKDNVLMWSHYADLHKGFVVGFDFNETIEALETTFGWVQYVNQNKELIKHLEKFYMMPFVKHESWYYENEIRFIKEGKNQINKEYEIPIKAIKEIILGVKMSELDKQSLYLYSQIELPHVKILYALTGNDGYSLIFKEYLPAKNCK